jgi:large subunit ribosomal protein L17
MRHRVADKKFNRDANERKALLSGLLRALVERGTIVTTRARAKVLKRLADRVIGQAKDSSLASRRLLHTTFGKRDVVNTLVDVIAPAMKDRNSGYTTMSVIGSRRGDNTTMVKMALVNIPANLSLQSGKEYPKAKKIAAAKPAAKKAEAKKPVKAKVEKKAAPAKKTAAKGKK